MIPVTSPLTNLPPTPDNMTLPVLLAPPLSSEGRVELSTSPGSAGVGESTPASAFFMGTVPVMLLKTKAFPGRSELSAASSLPILSCDFITVAIRRRERAEPDHKSMKRSAKAATMAMAPMAIPLRPSFSLDLKFTSTAVPNEQVPAVHSPSGCTAMPSILSLQ